MKTKAKPETKKTNKHPTKTTRKRPYVVVRTYSAGVHYGELISSKHTASGKEVVLGNTRRLWMWKGAFSLNEVAENGIQSGSKPSVAVSENTLTQAIEVIKVSPGAEKILREFPACP